MRLSEVFDHLAYGELSQLSLDGEEQGVTSPINRTKIISFINMGLIEIYKRFPISLKTATIQQIPHISDYHLDSRYALTNPHNTDDTLFPKYLMDSVFDPFKDDLMLIEGICDEAGINYTINDESDCETVITRGPSLISMPSPETEAAIFVNYRAAPEKIIITDNSTFNADDYIVPIDYQYLEPLINFVGHRAFSAFNANSPEAISYLQKFVTSCTLLEQTGLRHKDAISNTRLGDNGWL